METTLQELKLATKLQRLANLEPTEEFWEKFAEKQLKIIVSGRDPDESIQGTYESKNKFASTHVFFYI